MQPSNTATRRRSGVVRGALATALAAAALSVVPSVTTTASAAPAAPSAPAPGDLSFYDTPDSLPAGNGDLVRSEPADFFIDPLKVVRAPATATRVMYRTTDRNNTPIAVTGTVLKPNRAWTGPGERPIIGYAVGTQGLGDQCAPSRQMAAGSEYEGLFISGLLARGYGIVVTDYQGLGTEGLHTYMSREVQGRAVLDSIRAAQRLPGSGLPTNGPVGISGYSQGGGAAASAGELQPTYAPELKVKGIVAGAVPADLKPVAANLDGSLYFGFLGYAVGGLSESYAIDPAGYLNAKGLDTFATLSEQCTFDSIAAFPFVKSKTLTKDGRPITALVEEEPFKSVIAEQLIGNGRKPSAPTLVTHSTLDDVIPYAVGRNLAKRWCGQGAKIRLSSNIAPTHVGGALHSFPESFAFFEARFAGLPALSNCWAL